MAQLFEVRSLVSQRRDPAFDAREKARATALVSALAADAQVLRAASTWANMSFGERYQVALRMSVVARASAGLGPSPLYVSNEPQSAISARTRLSSGQVIISINVGHANWSDFFETLNSIAHETAHGAVHVLLATAAADDVQARAFRFNEKHHIHYSAGLSAHQAQPSEAHAYWFGQRVSEEFRSHVRRTSVPARRS